MKYSNQTIKEISKIFNKYETCKCHGYPLDASGLCIFFGVTQYLQDDEFEDQFGLHQINGCFEDCVFCEETERELIERDCMDRLMQDQMMLEMLGRNE